jgi:PAS domain S-box-containing protein
MPEVVYGNGAIQLAGRHASNVGATKVLIVTDPGVIDAGWSAKVEFSLRDANIAYARFSDVTPNPKDHEVMAGAAVYRQENCDLILAVGGGSPMDCAKGIGIVASNDRHIIEFEGVDQVPTPGPPLIFVPTTAGSSADVSQFAIISDAKRQVKIAIISKMVIPDIALVDPDTTVTMQPSLTAATGMDALCHAFEAFVSSAASALTDMAALGAVALISKNLIGAYQTPDDMVYRDNMMKASLMAGMAFSNASLGLVHAMAHSLGGAKDLPHGECNALLLERVVGFNFSAAPDKYAQLADAMGVDTRGLSAAVVARVLSEKIAWLRQQVGITFGLKEMGIQLDDLPGLARHVSMDPCLATNPKDATPEQIEAIFRETFQLTVKHELPGKEVPLPSGTISPSEKNSHQSPPSMSATEESSLLQKKREQFLGFSLQATRKSYYPQLQEQLNALRESEKHLRLLTDNLPARISFVDARLRYQFVNRAYEKVFGLPRDKIIGRPVRDLVGPENYAKFEAFVHRALAGLRTHCEIAVRHEAGHRIWLEVNFVPYADVRGRIVGFYDLTRDVTKRKQVEQELRRLRNYLSNIIDSMPSVIIGVDNDGKVTQWNRQAEQVTGLSPEKAQSKLLANLFPHLEGETDRIKMSIQDHRVIKDLKVPRKNQGETRFEDLTIFPLVTNGVEGAVIRIDDVTDRVRLEEMMIQNEKMLSVGRLAAGMAHEINNPLAGILQNASVLSNRLTGDLPANHKAAEASGTTLTAIRQYLKLRKIPDMLENIHTAGSLAATIVKNMLSFSRKSESVISNQDLGTLLDQTVDLLKTDYNMQKHYDFKQIKIIRKYDQTVASVPCEASKLQQVFMNILKNGADAMAEVDHPPAAPVFILRVRDEHNWVQVEIEDNGPGMDEKTRQRIFEPFFTTKPVGKGTGLGLSVSYFIITEDHGGEMSVHAVERGGTRFVIRLPKTRT